MLVGGMVAFGAHKMSQAQAKQIEEHTGVPPEELEDEDLEAAMTELNIPKQELTAQGGRGSRRRAGLRIRAGTGGGRGPTALR